MSRNRYTKPILAKMGYLENEVIDKIYNNIVTLFDGDINGSSRIRRSIKMEFIQKSMSEMELDVLKQFCDDTLELLEKEAEYAIKYDIVRDYVNNILKIVGKEPIDKLTDFVNVKRDDLINEECHQFALNSAKELFDIGFDKTKCGYGNRNLTPNYHITLLRVLLLQIGYVINRTRIFKTIGTKQIERRAFTIIKG